MSNSSENLVALQAHLAVLSDLSSGIQNARSHTKSLFKMHEYRPSLAMIQRLRVSVESSESQEAFKSGALAETADGSDVDAYRRIITKPIVPTRYVVGSAAQWYYRAQIFHDRLAIVIVRMPSY